MDGTTRALVGVDEAQFEHWDNPQTGAKWIVHWRLLDGKKRAFNIAARTFRMRLILRPVRRRASYSENMRIRTSLVMPGSLMSFNTPFCNRGTI